MKILRIAIAVLALGMALVSYWPGAWSIASAEDIAGTPVPEFPVGERWYNSSPLTLDALRGKVVLVEFWTRECINCIDVLPHTKALYDRYGKDGLVVIGVHTPEYDEERDPAALQAALRHYQITWPVIADNDRRVWNAYGNQYWPAIYLIDPHGKVVYYHLGEGDYEATEQRVRQLLGKA
jgi:thiol-disulfide isomerase/thioredoxin